MMCFNILQSDGFFDVVANGQVFFSHHDPSVNVNHTVFSRYSTDTPFEVGSGSADIASVINRIFLKFAYTYLFFPYFLFSIRFFFII